MRRPFPSPVQVAAAWAAESLRSPPLRGSSATTGAATRSSEWKQRHRMPRPGLRTAAPPPPPLALQQGARRLAHLVPRLRRHPL